MISQHILIKYSSLHSGQKNFCFPLPDNLVLNLLSSPLSVLVFFHPVTNTDVTVKEGILIFLSFCFFLVVFFIYVGIVSLVIIIERARLFL